jgi:CheY-like chemotaxis protein
MHRIVILIVDDDAGIRLAFSTVLAKIGCKIEVCTNPNGALGRMNEEPKPSFIFLDLNFVANADWPAVTPEETLTFIPKFREANPKAVIVIITGLVDEKIQQMSTTLGADAFRQKTDLSKLEDFTATLEEAIEAARKKGIEPFEVTTKMIARIAELKGRGSPLTAQFT